MRYSTYDDFVEALDLRLQEVPCKIWRNSQFTDEREVSLFATRMKWSGVRVPVHLCVSYMPKPQPSDFKRFAEESLLYARRAFGGPLFKVVFSSFAIVPVFVCDTADAFTIKHVQSRHYLMDLNFKNWWHGLDYYPVLYCLSTNTLYQWTGHAYVGGALYPHSRRFVKETIGAII